MDVDTCQDAGPLGVSASSFDFFDKNDVNSQKFEFL